ncbi:MAG: hypothetical protein R2865_14715 [Deinococcales bacterium]
MVILSYVFLAMKRQKLSWKNSKLNLTPTAQLDVSAGLKARDVDFQPFG